MCACTPEVRTPFCGRPGCEWPVAEPLDLERIEPFSIFAVEPFVPAPAPACPAGHLEVRCCCVPENLLGWLPAPSADAPVLRIGPRAERAVHFPIVGTHAVRVTLVIDRFWVFGQDDYDAYRSEEVPLEVLRLIPGFVPAVVQT